MTTPTGRWLDFDYAKLEQRVMATLARGAEALKAAQARAEAREAMAWRHMRHGSVLSKRKKVGPFSAQRQVRLTLCTSLGGTIDRLADYASLTPSEWNLLTLAAGVVTCEVRAAHRRLL